MAAHETAELRSVITDVYTVHREALVRFAQTYVASTDEAEELVHTVIFRVLRRRRGPPIDAFYLRRAVHNEALNARRALRVRKHHQEGLGEHLSTLATPLPPPEELRRRRLRELLEDALRGLPEAQREAFMTVRVRGLSPREAAVRLGRASNTIRVQVQQAQAKIRVQLSDRGVTCLADVSS